ncbi:hypothetical protein EIN_207050 [Entamoeba invadens IP1]|uniref:Uncharacterized protein n=1 Tax=Entamoeba invadens IP1 TaxID=370355 RepID=A0A0A1UFI5_ENTIV|nr:hypothetical protein EIN_207050 [Entamoeba invadens IP1]ELP91668.1 hypothetical protein EIN_207050 [Entamoeba invadens IP1]|eukprot:XP_004258439.1 hypothetical protein EIN_207050 [Entamoeba invadens IP1]
MSASNKGNGEPEGCVQWADDEIQTLRTNMENNPKNRCSDLKRYTLLLTNLPHKRLRDVATRVKFIEYTEAGGTLGWAEFCRDKNLARPLHTNTSGKAHNSSSQESDDVESSSVKGKPTGRMTPMMDSIENVLGSIQDDTPNSPEPKHPPSSQQTLQIQVQPTQPSKRQTKAKNIRKGKTTNGPISTSKSPKEEFKEVVAMKQVPFTNAPPPPVQKQQVTPQTTTQPIQQPLPIQSIPSIKIAQTLQPQCQQIQQVPQELQQQPQQTKTEEKTTDPDFKNRLAMIMTNANQVLDLLYQHELDSGQISFENINNFLVYVQQISQFTEELAKPYNLPTMFMIPYSMNEIQQLVQAPQLIKMYDQATSSSMQSSNL